MRAFVLEADFVSDALVANGVGAMFSDEVVYALGN